MAEHGGVDPERLVEALKAAGCREVGRRPGLYVRMEWPTGSLTIPLDRSYADYDTLIGDVLAELRYAAEVGAKARQVLDTLEGAGRLWAEDSNG